MELKRDKKRISLPTLSTINSDYERKRISLPIISSLDLKCKKKLINTLENNVATMHKEILHPMLSQGKIISKVLEFLQIVVDESYVAYKYADDKRRTANGQIILNIARCGIPEDIAKTLSSKEWKIHRQRLAIYGNISFLHIYDVYLKKEIILQTKEPNKSKVPYECFREYSIETKEQRRKNFETY